MIFMSFVLMVPLHAMDDLKNGLQTKTNRNFSSSNTSKNIESWGFNFLSVGDATYCIPTYQAGCGSGDRIINVSLSGESSNLDNDSSCSPNGYGDFTNDVSRPDLASGETYTLSVSTDIGFPSQEQVRAWIDYNEDGLFSDDEEIANTQGYGLGTGTGIFDFTVPGDVDPGDYRMRIRMVYGMEPPTFDACSEQVYGETEDYTVRVIDLDDCQGTPTAGTIDENNFSVCAGNEFTLNVTGASSPANGLEYIWQSSPAGENVWTDVEGPTAVTYTVEIEIEEATDFRFKVTCTNSNETDISELVSVNLKPAEECYCAPIYTAGCSFGDRITNVSLIGVSESLNNDSLCSDNGYGDFTNLTPADLAPGETYSLSVSTDRTSPNFLQIRAWIDFDQDGQFSEDEEIANSNGDGLGSGTKAFDFVVPGNLDAGNYRMRVRMVYSASAPTFDACSVEGDGETEDYIVEIIELDGCQGTPTAGTINEDDFNICPNFAFSLSVSGATQPSSGLQRIWQSSPVGEDIWTDIPGATSTSYTFTNGVEEDSDFRYKVTCTNSEESDVSNIVTVSVNPANECYCTPVYTTACVSGDRITNVSLTGDSVSINNDSQCSANGYADYTDLPSADLTVGQTYNLSVSTDYGNPSFEQVRAWIDYDRDGQFSEDEEIANTNGDGLVGGTGIFSFAVPDDLDAGDYRMRVRLVYGSAAPTFSACSSEAYGEAEDYSLTIDDTMSVDNQIFESFSFYPNPTQDQLTLKAAKKIESVRLYNLLGQEIISLNPGSLQAKVNVENLQPGVYLMSPWIRQRKPLRLSKNKSSSFY